MQTFAITFPLEKKPTDKVHNTAPGQSRSKENKDRNSLSCFAASWGLCFRSGNETEALACLGRWSFPCPAAGRIQSKTTLWKLLSYAANNYSCPNQTRKSFPRRVKLAKNSAYKGEST